MRARAQALTGRTLEQSYEGFTGLVASAADVFASTDQSTTARKRGQRRR